MTGPVGVAGCGRMGLPMARAMRARGIEVVGFDVRPRAEFGSFAAHMTDDPAALGRCPIVFSIVRDIAQTEELLFTRQAILNGAERPGLLVISSTVSPRYIADLARRMPPGTRLVDAPMSGAPVAAEEARLSFMLGGAEADLDRLQPALDAMGAKFHRLGPTGAGMTVKVLNNYLAAISTVAVRQALDWADGLGVDERALLDVMHDSSGQTWFGSNFERIEFARHGFDAENTIGILKKDVESLLDALAPEAREGLPDRLIACLQHLSPRPRPPD
ncbi:NAD-binding protein [Rhodobacteraceae bacterium NNCM2]|nr:NAD-binding protein [Coraliihabitans acroporae]